MATLTASCSSSSSWILNNRSLRFPTHSHQISKYLPSHNKTQILSWPCSSKNSKRLNFHVRAENKDEPTSSSVYEAKNGEPAKKDLQLEGELQEESGSEKIEREKQQEMDWWKDEDFKKFMGNPSIEAAVKFAMKRTDWPVKELEEVEEALEALDLVKLELDWWKDKEFKNFIGNRSIETAAKLEKKRADWKLKELDRESSSNPIARLINSMVRDNLYMLEEAAEAFESLDLNKLKSCFGLDTFFVTDVRRSQHGGIFIGNLRKPIQEVIPKLEKKLSEAAGRDVVLWFMEEKTDDITKQACVVQPKLEIDFQLETNKLSTPLGYVSEIVLRVTTFGTIALTYGSFLKPDATIDDYLANVVPLFGGFLTIFGVSEITTRVTASRYGVKLSPSFLVPSNWTGCLGVMNDYESLLPNKKSLFDIPVARTASAYVTSLLLVLSAFISDGSFNGGDNALYIRPQFFENYPLLSFIEYVIGPYSDDLGNVLPYAVEGVGVPVNPLAFAGLLGMFITSLNLLPSGRLEGGRIAQAMFGRRYTTFLSFATSVLLGFGGLSGSAMCLAWGVFSTHFRGGEEIPAQDEITPLGNERFVLGFVLFLVCFVTLLSNVGGTFCSSFFAAPYFRGDL